ncbi:MAG: hypothetical protein K6T68_09220 [Alicyclobacillus shizuokensis]|nr:hypothetical protein [Alicyclobacillus shizuokensis]
MKTFILRLSLRPRRIAYFGQQQRTLVDSHLRPAHIPTSSRSGCPLAYAKPLSGMQKCATIKDSFNIP